ncbi:hypothetical protein CHCC20335_3882 [Bacillus paralicheniformis]|nr:hypothetical protein CHCC20335_3882 [Bacillus paralicheniformis]
MSVSSFFIAMPCLCYDTYPGSFFIKHGKKISCRPFDHKIVKNELIFSK